MRSPQSFFNKILFKRLRKNGICFSFFKKIHCSWRVFNWDALNKILEKIELAYGNKFHFMKEMSVQVVAKQRGLDMDASYHFFIYENVQYSRTPIYNNFLSESEKIQKSISFSLETSENNSFFSNLEKYLYIYEKILIICP